MRICVVCAHCSVCKTFDSMKQAREAGWNLNGIMSYCPEHSTPIPPLNSGKG